MTAVAFDLSGRHHKVDALYRPKPVSAPALLEPQPKSGWGFMLGRYQPWHPGHFELFRRILLKHPVGVVIGIRNTFGTTNKDPYTPEEVAGRIEADLLHKGYQGKYQIVILPDIQGIYYGRDVGYVIEKIELPQAIQAISATKIRQSEIQDPHLQPVVHIDKGEGDE
jgi:hypothetical protein